MSQQLSADIISLLKSGKITIHQGDKKLVEVDADNNNVTVNILNLTKEIATPSRIIATLTEARGMAHALKERGVTLTVSANNKKIVKLGSDAKPKFSRLITRSKNVEITNLRELRLLDRRLRAN